MVKQNQIVSNLMEESIEKVLLLLVFGLKTQGSIEQPLFKY